MRPHYTETATDAGQAHRRRHRFVARRLAIHCSHSGRSEGSVLLCWRFDSRPVDLDGCALCWQVCILCLLQYIPSAPSSLTPHKMSVCASHTLRDIKDFTVQVGITRRHSYAYYGQMVKVQRVIPHPQYNAEIIHDNDIALFQVRATVLCIMLELAWHGLDVDPINLTVFILLFYAA